MTARHVVIYANRDDNELVKYDSSQPRRNVLLFSKAATEKQLTAIESEIKGKEIIIKQLKKRLDAAGQMEPAYAEAEMGRVNRLLEEANNAIKYLQAFLPDATRDWNETQNRVIGYVFLSPPIARNVGDSGFIED